MLPEPMQYDSNIGFRNLADTIISGEKQQGFAWPQQRVIFQTCRRFEGYRLPLSGPFHLTPCLRQSYSGAGVTLQPWKSTR